MIRKQGRGVATGEATKAPISGAPNDRYASTQKREDPSWWLGQQGELSRSHDGFLSG